MVITHNLRKLFLLLHTIFSVGWFGAVAVFFVLNTAALINPYNQLFRSLNFSMNLIAWYVILPFCLLSLATGIIQSLATPWGLLKHYWVAAKLILTLGATFLLVMHMPLINQTAEMTSERPSPNPGLHGLTINLFIKSGLALITLLATTTISIYKPWGKIHMRQYLNNDNKAMIKKDKSRLSPKFYLFIGVTIVVIIFITMHLIKGRMGNH